jgi:hypothetical protein
VSDQNGDLLRTKSIGAVFLFNTRGYEAFCATTFQITADRCKRRFLASLTSEYLNCGRVARSTHDSHT